MRGPALDRLGDELRRSTAISSLDGFVVPVVSGPDEEGRPQEGYATPASLSTAGGAIPLTQKDAANGVAALNSSSQLFPSYIPLSALRHVYLDSGLYGDWDKTGAIDALATLEAAQEVAVANGLWIDGGDKENILGIDGSTDTGWAPVGNVRLANITLKDIKAGTHSASRTLFAAADLDKVFMEDVKIDRNGDGSGGSVSASIGLHALRIGELVLRRVEATGNDAGIGIAFVVCHGARLENCYVHDIFYVHVAQTDDTVQGILASASENICITDTVVKRLGRTDQTVVQRDRYSRGIAVTRCTGLVARNQVYRVDQGIDITGGGGSRRLIVPHNLVEHTTTYGIKVANTSKSVLITENDVFSAGLAAIVISGPSIELANMPKSITVSWNNISGVGASGYWGGLGGTARGIAIMAGTGTVAATTPRAVKMRGNDISSEQGTSTFTVHDTDEIAIVTPLWWATGQRVRLTTSGSLPSGLALATDYYAIPQDDTYDSGVHAGRIKLATSYINALDGVAISGISGGSGTHTITQFSDMAYGETGGDAAPGSDPNIFGSDNTVRGATTAVVLSPHTNHHVLTRAQTIPTGVDTDLAPNSTVEIGVKGITSASSGIFTALEYGRYRIVVHNQWASNVTGARYLRVYTNIAGGGFTADPYAMVREEASTLGAHWQHIDASFTLNAGDQLKVVANQNSGGDLVATFKLTVSREWN